MSKFPALARASRWLPWILLLVVVADLARGILPFAPVEGDEQACLNGLEIWSRHPALFPGAAYLYEIQPGSYQIIAQLQRWTGADYIVLFGVCTVLGATIFIALSSLILTRVTLLPIGWCALIALCGQELVTAAYYLNTSALAGAFVMGGIALTMSRRPLWSLWLASLALAIGGWLRLDALLITPAVLGLKLYTGLDGRRALRQTAAISTITLVILLGLLTLAHTSLSAAWINLRARGISGEWQPLIIKGPLVLSYVLFLTSFAGVALLVCRRQWHLLSVVVLGVVPSIFIYGRHFTTTKYLYYAAPFLLLPGLWLLRESLTLPTNRRWIGRLAFGTLIFAGLIESCIGLQTSSAAYRRFDPAALSVTFASGKRGEKTWAWGLGEGEIIPTDDAFRMRGALAFAPEVWHRQKVQILGEVHRLDVELSRPGTTYAVTSTYLSMVLVHAWLWRHGFMPGESQTFLRNETSHTTAWTAPGRTMTVVFINQTTTEAQEFSEATKHEGGMLFINDRGDLAFRHLASDPVVWRQLSPVRNGLLTLYAHR
jgi:hypothetical protein